MEQKLSRVSETLLIPLWARAVEAKRPEPIVKDDRAAEILEKIQYDYTKFDRAWKSQVGVSIRTMLLDRATEAFIEKHPDALVVNLGAGLDTRYFRVDNGEILWWDLDLPEVIGLRRTFFEESRRRRMIAKSVFDYSWISDLDAHDRPVLIIAEGLLMYFEEHEVRNLMNRLVLAFPGAEMLLEVLAPILVKNEKRHDSVGKIGAAFKWGASRSRDMETFHGAIRFVEEWNYFDYHRARWRWMGWFALVPAFKNRFNNRIVHLRFAGNGLSGIPEKETE